MRILKAGAQSVSRGFRVFLWISQTSEVGTVELDVFCRNRERVVLRMGRVNGDLRGLDLQDDVEWRVVAEEDGKLAAASEGMDSKSHVTRGNEDRSFFRKPSRSEDGSSLEVGQESNGFDKITLSLLGVVCGTVASCLGVVFFLLRS
jgi:hypothetical protein